VRGELGAARTAEADLGGEVAAPGSDSNMVFIRFRAEITELEASLAAAIDERNKLRGEIGSMKRDTESTWAAERVENALLRERINDVAAEVARLTAALEGPGSPIESMLAEAASEPRGAGAVMNAHE